MSKVTIVLLAMIITLTAIPVSAQTSPKAVLIFRLPLATLNSDPGSARSVTLAFKEAMMQAGASDVMVFDPDSPLVARALLEKSLPASVAEADIPIADAMKAARVLGARFVVLGEREETGKKIQLLMGDVSANEVTSLDAMDGSEQDAKKLKESARTFGKQVWARISALVDQGAQDPDKAAKIAADAVVHAQKLVDSGDLDQASEALNDAIRVAPKDPEVRLALGQIYLSQGKMANAIVELRTATNLDPTKLTYRLWLSDAYTQKQMYNDAVDEIKRGIALTPTEGQLYAQLGKVYFLRGALDDSVTQLNRSVELNPNKAEVQILLGDVLMKKGRTSQAATAYLAATKLQPTNALFFQRLATAYANNGNLGESLAASMSALKNSPLNDAQRYNEGVRLVDEHARGLLAKYQSDLQVYQNGAMGKGDFSTAVRVLAGRAGTLLKFMEGFTPPKSLKEANRHRNLGLSLLSQAATSQMMAVDTGNADYSEDARLLMLEAQRELAKARTGA